MRLAVIASLIGGVSLCAQVPAPVTVLELKGVANGLITVRVNAPAAKAVAAYVDTMAPRQAIALTHDERGVWAGSIPSLGADIYDLLLLIDGTQGGGQARTIGLSRTDLFRWIGTFSGTIPSRGTLTVDAAETMFGSLFEDPLATNAEIKLWQS